MKPAATSVRTGNPERKGDNPRYLRNISINPLDNNAVSTNTRSAGPANHTAELLPEFYQPIQFKYAILLNASVEEINNVKLWQFIDDWYGTRYRYGGNSKDGIDCSSFAGNLMASVFGLSLPRTAHEQYEQTSRISKKELQPGDLVFFNTRGGISHVGVYLFNNKFVHASTNGVTISGMDEEYYSRRFVGARRAKP